MPERYQLMRSTSAARLKGKNGESLGLQVGTPEHLGPGSYGGHNPWNRNSAWRPKSAGSSFKSARPRVPVDSSSWLILSHISRELNCSTLEDDQRLRIRTGDGRPKGVVISRPQSAPAGGRA